MSKPLYYTVIFMQKLGYIVFYPLHKIFVSIKINGRENLIGLNKPIIIASNHTSELDVTIAPLLFPFFSKFFPIYFVSNSREKWRTFGWRNYIYGGVFFNMLGGYALYSGHHDYAISLEQHIDLLKNGRTVFIFPEGRRTLDGNLGPAHGGLGFLAYTTDATIVPIAINTFYDMSLPKYFSGSKKVVINILKPIHKSELFNTANPSIDDFKNVSQIVLNKIAGGLE